MNQIETWMDGFDCSHQRKDSRGTNPSEVGLLVANPDVSPPLDAILVDREEGDAAVVPPSPFHSSRSGAPLRRCMCTRADRGAVERCSGKELEAKGGRSWATTAAAGWSAREDWGDRRVWWNYWDRDGMLLLTWEKMWKFLGSYANSSSPSPVTATTIASSLLLVRTDIASLCVLEGGIM